MKISDLNELKKLLNSISDGNKVDTSVFIEKIGKEVTKSKQYKGDKENLFSDCKSSMACFLELLFYARLRDVISENEFITCVSMYINEVEKDSPKGGNFSDL